LKARWAVVVAVVLPAILGFAGPPLQSHLRVVVLEGDGVVNTIGKDRMPPQQITVRVEDEAGKPVSGATVFFQLPSGEVPVPGGSIGDKAAAAVLSDSVGLAKMTFQPNKLAGTFKIDITASLQGATASALVTQTNEQLGARSKIKGLFSAIYGGEIPDSSPSAHKPGSLDLSTVSPGPGLPAFAQVTTLKSALNGVNPTAFGVPMTSRLTAGDTPMTFTASSSASWFTVSPTSGTIVANGTTEISIVAINAVEAPDGVSNGLVAITAPGYQDNTQMQVSLNCGATDSHGNVKCTIRMTLPNSK